MHRRHPLYLVVYDISCDKERGRTAALLEAYGVRIQESVFEARLTRALKSTLQRALFSLELKTGWVAFFRVEERSLRWHTGIPPHQPLSEDRHAWVL